MNPTALLTKFLGVEEAEERDYEFSSPGHVSELVLDTYDFSGCKRVVQVGGQHGVLLTQLLLRYSALDGVLFDSPTSIATARRCVAMSGVSDRCTVVAGSALVSVPPGADVYVLSRVIENWGDTASLRILSNCRRAMPSHARLLLIEPMMTLPAVTLVRDGRARTKAQYGALLAMAGLTMTNVIPTLSHTHIIEARHT